MKTVRRVARGKQALLTRSRLSPSVVPQEKPNFVEAGQCLRRRIGELPYHALQADCPMCGAPQMFLCQGLGGEPAFVPHISRQWRAAMAYRERVRQQAALARSKAVAS